MKNGNSRHLTARQRADLDALADLPDGQTDTTEMFEVRHWGGAKRSLYCRLVKKQLTLRINADVTAWFKF